MPLGQVTNRKAPPPLSLPGEPPKLPKEPAKLSAPRNKLKKWLTFLLVLIVASIIVYWIV